MARSYSASSCSTRSHSQRRRAVRAMSAVWRQSVESMPLRHDEGPVRNVPGAKNAPAWQLWLGGLVLIGLGVYGLIIGSGASPCYLSALVAFGVVAGLIVAA